MHKLAIPIRLDRKPRNDERDEAQNKDGETAVAQRRCPVARVANPMENNFRR
jgi:hypothetical protein